MADYQFCRVEREGAVLTVTLNRPEVMNALHRPAHFELGRVFDEFAADPSLWIAIVTGAGDKAFSAGRRRAASLARRPRALPALPNASISRSPSSPR